MNLPNQITGQRIILRPSHLADPQTHFALVRASYSELSRYLTWPRKYKSVADADAALEKFKQRWSEGRFTYSVYLLDGTMVGNINCKLRDGWHGEIGYWLGTAHTGQGYMTEAVNLLTDTVFDHGIHRMVIRCDIDNKVSARVAERTGFTYEGRLRHVHQDEDGGFYDLFQYARLSSDPAPEPECLNR